MKRRSVLVPAAALVVAILGVALAVPRSPWYLPKLLEPPPQFEGHTTPYWVDALGEPDLEARRHAAHALGMIGPDADASIPALARMMTDDADRGARIEASLALTKMKPESPALAEAVPALMRGLEDTEDVVRLNAAIALVRLNTEATRPAVPALLKAVRDSRNESNGKMFTFTIRDIAAVALGQASAGTAEAVPVLHEMLKSAKSPITRQFVVRALGAVGPHARPTLPDLRPLLKDRDYQIATAAEDAIEKIEKAAPPAN